MPEKFVPIIYQQQDPANPKQSVWVRIRPGDETIIIETFRSRPTDRTEMRESITSFEYGPCYDDQSKIRLWNEKTNPDIDDGTEVVLVESLSKWGPQRGRE